MPVDWTDLRFVDADVNLDNEQRLLIDKLSGKHPTVLVATDERAAAIDIGLAELVYWMWRNGIITDSSCQGANDMDPADIEFRSVNDLAALLTIVAPQDDIAGGLWDRVTGSNLCRDSEKMWEYLFFPAVVGRRPQFSVSAMFPLTDVPELVARLRP